MIGKISMGKSFRGCISYCLEDKLRINSSEQVFKDRAEVIGYNLCYGNKNELIQQFNDVRNLNSKLAKPVMHITLSLSPGEALPKEKLASMAEDCAKDLGFEKNQYLVVLHKDTEKQHIHIVVNRVGFDKKTVKDNQNYQKIANYCRKMEQKHQLKAVLNPKRYLPEKLRQLPRFDERKEKLKQDIVACLKVSRNFQQFEQLMKKRNYEILKGRGITFFDNKKVRIKGSEVGYSLAKIEKILSLSETLKDVFMKKEKHAVSSSEPIKKTLQETNASVHAENHHHHSAKQLISEINTPRNDDFNLQWMFKRKRKRKKGLGI